MRMDQQRDTSEAARLMARARWSPGVVARSAAAALIEHVDDLDPADRARVHEATAREGSDDD